MINQPLVSILMNCYNGEKYIREAIDSVIAQTYTNWEIIFWDNASTDSSAEIAQSYDDKLKYFCVNETSELYEARNYALEKCTGKYVAFLDCDDIWMENKLEVQLQYANKYPEAGLFYSNAVNVRNGKNGSVVFKSKNDCDVITFQHLLVRYDVSMCTLLVARSLLNEYGGFDKRFTVTGDMELCVRLAHDHPVLRVSEVLAKIGIHDDCLTLRKMGLFSDEKLLLLEKMIYNYDGFLKEYTDESIFVVRNSMFKKAVVCWRDGNSVLARKLIVNSGLTIKNIVFFIMTFFPSKMYLKTSNVYRHLFM